MRFFDNWWEHASTIARLALLVIAVVAVAISHPLPMDYYWE
jgi:hypothetical protein